VHREGCIEIEEQYRRYAVYILLRQCAIPPLIECPDKAGMYRDSAGHHPHLIPPLHQAISFGALSPNYPAEQPILKHGGITYSAERALDLLIAISPRNEFHQFRLQL
jgi:hypothetical protein